MLNSHFPKKVKVTEFSEKKTGSLNPVLVSFQNGDVNSEYVKEMKPSLHLNEFGDTCVEIETSDNQVFKAVNVGKSKMRQFIAIRKKKSRKMRILEVDSALLINAALISTDNKSGLDTTQYAEETSKLYKTFGGKKIASRLHQKDKLNVSSSVTEAKISLAIKDVKTEDDKNLSYTLAESESIIQLLPPCNRDAEKLSDVYLLSDILNHDEMEELKSEVSNVGLDKKMDMENEYSQFFHFCYNQVKKSEDNIKKKLAGILFMEVLIKFLKTPIKQLQSKKANFCTFSSLIHAKVINDFCIKSGKTITCPLSMKDKVLCHIMVINLICCNYEIDLKKLASVVSVHFNRLSRLARAVGVLPTSTNDTTFKLKLPLPPLPKSSINKTRKRRIKKS